MGFLLTSHYKNMSTIYLNNLPLDVTFMSKQISGNYGRNNAFTFPLEREQETSAALAPGWWWLQADSVPELRSRSPSFETATVERPVSSLQ